MNTLPVDVLKYIFTFVGSANPGGALVLSETCKDWKEVVRDTPDAWVLPSFNYSTLSKYKTIDDWMRGLGREKGFEGFTIHAHVGEKRPTNQIKEVIDIAIRLRTNIQCLEVVVTEDVIPLLTTLNTSSKLQQLILDWENVVSAPDVNWIIPGFCPNLVSLHLLHPPLSVLKAFAETQSLPNLYEFRLICPDNADVATFGIVTTLLKRHANELVCLQLTLPLLGVGALNNEVIALPDLEELVVKGCKSALPFTFLTPKLQLYVTDDFPATVSLEGVTTLVVDSPNIDSATLKGCTSLQTLVIVDFWSMGESNVQLGQYKQLLSDNLICPLLVNIHSYDSGIMDGPHKLQWKRADGRQVVVITSPWDHYKNANYFKLRPWACPESRKIYKKFQKLSKDDKHE